MKKVRHFVFTSKIKNFRNIKNDFDERFYSFLLICYLIVV